MSGKKNDLGEVMIYRTRDSKTALDVRLHEETVWLNQYQLAKLFGRERSVLTKHIRNIFTEGELKPKAVCAKFAQTGPDGKTYQVDHYNLDLIISVGYRVKSREGVRFRQWATQTLKEHLVRGYTLNRQRFEKNAQELEAALTHETARGLRDAGLMETKTMRKFDVLCLPRVKEYTATQIKRIRERNKASQLLSVLPVAENTLKTAEGPFWRNVRREGIAA